MHFGRDLLGGKLQRIGVLEHFLWHGVRNIDHDMNVDDMNYNW